MGCVELTNGVRLDSEMTNGARPGRVPSSMRRLGCLAPTNGERLAEELANGVTQLGSRLPSTCKKDISKGLCHEMIRNFCGVNLKILV
jgi:hypothetical protein